MNAEKKDYLDFLALLVLISVCALLCLITQSIISDFILMGNF